MHPVVEALQAGVPDDGKNPPGGDSRKGVVEELEAPVKVS